MVQARNQAVTGRRVPVVGMLILRATSLAHYLFLEFFDTLAGIPSWKLRRIRAILRLGIGAREVAGAIDKILEIREVVTDYSE